MRGTDRSSSSELQFLIWVYCCSVKKEALNPRMMASAKPFSIAKFAISILSCVIIICHIKSPQLVITHKIYTTQTLSLPLRARNKYNQTILFDNQPQSNQVQSSLCNSRSLSVYCIFLM